MADTYDLIIIGAGPGGYVAAIRAAQLGLKTALIEKRKTLGGTCLNVGCIPSKALLHSTEIYHFVNEKGAGHGYKVEGLDIDVPALMKKKDEVVKKLVGGVGQLVEKRGVEVITGTGRLAGKGKVIAGTAEGERELSADNIILASGSAPVELPFLKFDGKTIVSSDDAIGFDAVPEKLVVVGAGAIGLELGCVWARLGSDVTVVELLEQIMPFYDEDVSKTAQRIFKKQGLKFELGAKVTGCKKERKKHCLTAERGGEELKFEADRILVSVGRRPVTETLSLEEAGVELDEHKRIKTGKDYRTSAEGIYAIGDIIAGPMLAHKAEDEGVACVEHIAGRAGHVNYTTIPNVVYTDPEIASVGMLERDCKEQGIAYKVGKFNVAANGRALATDATDGFVKILADKETDRILGAQLIAKNGSELIASIVAHMEYGGSAEDLGRTVHAHPTLSESIKEAALAVNKEALHAL